MKNNWMFLFYAFIVLNALDLASTALVINVLGPAAEMNIFIRWVIVEYGMFGVFLVKALGIVIIYKMRQYIRDLVLFVINVIFTVVVVGNFMHYYMLNI